MTADEKWWQELLDEYGQEAEVMESMTDDGAAARLVFGYRDKFRRISDMRRWYAWDGMRWVHDHESSEIRDTARWLARCLPDDNKEQRAYKRNQLSSAGLSACIRLAETDRRTAILAERLDAHPELLNTPGGVVNLRNGYIFPHDPDLLLTRITGCQVGLNQNHPQWDRFLWETFADAELIAYMKRLAGLALIGNVTEHVLPFLHGTGANGKGVFTLVLQGLLGDADAGGYALSAPDGFLMAGRETVHPTEVARLRGARLVVCSEQTSGKRFDEAKVKRLTGGDRLTGRFMHGDFFDFDPSHLLWVMSNHLPEVKEGGPSFWRRVRRVPFLHVVPEEARVPDLHQQLLAAEGPAILGWAVAGAVEVLSSGLRDPESVTRATHEYEISEDSLASFVEEECLRGPHYWCVVSDFHQRYEDHCEETGVTPLSARGLAIRLQGEYGIIRDRTKGKPQRRIYRGLGLQSTSEEE